MSTSAATPAAENDGTSSRWIRWLKTGAMWTLAAPFVLLYGLIVVGLPGAVAVRVVEWTFGTGMLALEIAVVTLLMVLTVAALWWAFAHGGAISRLHFGRLEPTVRALVVTIFAIATFSGLTALLYLEGGLEIRGGPIPDDVIVDQASEVYAWHLVDTLPLVDLTDNLQWEPAFEFEDRVGGLLLMAFTGFVILPLVQVVRLIFAGPRKTYPVAVLNEIRRASKGARITESSVVANRIVVAEEERFVVVDVMTEVWTEDAPLRRLRRLEDRDFGKPLAYFLVVDGIADRARDRLEPELAAAPFPARLLVWRGDEPPAPVSEELDRLRAELARSAA